MVSQRCTCALGPDFWFGILGSLRSCRIVGTTSQCRNVGTTSECHTVGTTSQCRSSSVATCTYVWYQLLCLSQSVLPMILHGVLLSLTSLCCGENVSGPSRFLPSRKFQWRCITQSLTDSYFHRTLQSFRMGLRPAISGDLLWQQRWFVHPFSCPVHLSVCCSWYPVLWRRLFKVFWWVCTLLTLPSVPSSSSPKFAGWHSTRQASSSERVTVLALALAVCFGCLSSSLLSRLPVTTLPGFSQ